MYFNLAQCIKQTSKENARELEFCENSVWFIMKEIFSEGNTIDNNHEKLTLNGEEKLSREEVNKTRKMIFEVTKNCNEVKQ